MNTLPNLWNNPWWNLYMSPFSGNSAEGINPITTLMSPSYSINFAGNQQVERKVVEDVASYGKQLGKLSEAVLELANGEKGAAVEALKKLVAQIEYVKGLNLEKSLEQQLNRLKESDPDGFNKLLEKYQ